MRLGDVDLVADADERRLLVERFNATDRPFPAERTVGELFAEQAARTPRAEAVIDATGRWTYAELAREVDALAAYLVARGVGPEVHVGVLLRRSRQMAVALLATLRAGGVFVPLNPGLPRSRLTALLDDVGAPLIVCERALIAEANALQWECPSVALLLCADSDDVRAELEPPGARMDAELWDVVAANAAGPIEAGGWRSAHSGELLSEAAMAAFADGAVAAVAPLLPPDAEVLEIGCGSGLTLAALAPLTARYVGTDISAAALEWARRGCVRDGLGDVALHRLEALELDRLPRADDGPFDAVVINSVVQSLGGFNHLRAVLRAAVARVRDGGCVYAGHVWDPDRRAALPPERRLDALFVPAAFFEQLPAELPRVAAVELRPIGCDVPDLAAYAYDVVLHVGRRRRGGGARTPGARKRQEDRTTLPLDPAPQADRHRPDAAAYLIQTSGSTGRPRSVTVETRSLVNLLWWYRDAAGIDAQSRVAQVIPSSFDASVKNLLAPLVSGGALVLLDDGPYDPAALLALIERERVTVLNPGVPSMAYPLVELAAERAWEGLRSLRCLALGGEAPDLARLRPWLESEACGARVLNVYGPTECADIACWHEATADDLESRAPLPIGRPVHNAQAYVLGARLELEPIGVVGELCISGAGLARGYAGQPELTAERFPPHPFRPGERIYRTGDLARRLPGGEIVLHGRADAQVKVRGHRIELAEVERALRELAGVRDAAAVALGSDGERRLVGYVLAAEPFDERAAGALLRRTLPAAVVPERIVALDRWPLNAHGKLDRRALPAPGAARAAGRPPRTELERTLAAAWREVLSVERDVGAEEVFFEVGGDSLRAALLATRLRDALALSVTDLYRAQTVAEQAALVRARRERAAGPLHALGPAAAPPLFCLPPIAGFAWTFAELARRLERVAVHAFDVPAVDDPVQTCADAVEEGAPVTPLLLAGYSAGGLLAVAVAGELERRGLAVGGVALLDAAPHALRERHGPEAVRALAEEVVADPRLAAHVALTGRERVARVVAAYAGWYDRAPAPPPLAADLLVLTADGADPAWADGWRSATTGRVSLVAGAGSHDALLSAPHVAANAALLAGWLEGRVR